ncbi:taurine catabolism dioxygenase [Ramaria rubella]|nr:taurine catabolism dioxygenase [Ramaria rubella]
MSPVATSTAGENDAKLTRSRLEKPLRYGGSLDKFQHVEVTPVVGRLYLNVQASDLLKASNARDLLQDLAVTISQRGVVFFRNQNITLAEQKQFVQLIGELSGKPSSSTLHVHPLFESADNEAVDDKGNFDKEVYVVSNRAQLKMYKDMAHRKTVTDAAVGWHTDCTFEPIPADYSCLIMSNTPATGGDTMWCSSAALYDKISPPYRAFLETLTATYAQPVFVKSAERGKFDIMSPRGSPLNCGTEFSSVHPVIRTNPVTGLKSVFAVGLHCEKINNVHPYEDKQIRDYFLHLITRSHDIQVRHKWEPNDMAIWDNRSVYHAATPDVGEGIRFGNRVTSIGEKPYLDPTSKSLTEAITSGNA